MSTHLSKTDSEASSLAQSSPSRDRQAIYYVQSPSRDSHDEGEKTSNSFHSTPAALSPMGSPPHSHSNSSLGPHSSRVSSSTRLSGSLRPAGHDRKHSQENRKRKGWRGGLGGGGGVGGGGKDYSQPFDAIEEEGLLLDEGGEMQRRSKRCWYFGGFVVGFVVLFTLFSLILWGASKPQKPKITMKAMVFDQFVVQAGSDARGLGTSMVSLNCSVKLTFRNTATFFGLHVTATPFQLSYSQINLATGFMRRFYQSRQSQRTVTVTVQGDKKPIYGGGPSLSSVKGAPAEPVPLTLGFMIRSRAYVLGKLVKSRFHKRIECHITMDPKTMNKRVPLKHNCTYYE